MAEATLRDVVDALVDVRNAQENTADMIDENKNAVGLLSERTLQMFKMFDRKMDADRLRAEEDRRERAAQQRLLGNQMSPAAMPDAMGDQRIWDDVMHGTALGVLASRISGVVGRLVAGMTKFVLAPLGLIARLVVRSGPLAATVGLMWATFRDIGENEEFQAALQGVRDLWNNQIVPTWQRLREMFDDFLHTEGMENTIAAVAASWTSVTNWFENRFRPAMHDFLINTLGNFTETISTVVDGVNQILDGDPLGGIVTMFRGLFTGVATFIDDHVTAALRILGIDFEEGETWASTIRSGLADMRDSFVAGWNNIKNFVSDYVGGWWTDITTSIALRFIEISQDVRERISGAVDFVSDIRDMLLNLRETINDRVETVVDFISGVLDSGSARLRQMQLLFENALDNVALGFERVATFIQNIPDRLLSLVTSILDFEIPPLTIPVFGRDLTIYDGGRPFAGISDARAAANERISLRNDEMNSAVSRLESSIASRLEELNQIQAELQSQRGAAPITVIAPSSQSNVQHTSTSVMAFPSPMNEYGPQ